MEPRRKNTLQKEVQKWPEKAVADLKKTQLCERLKNGIVKIRPQFPSKSPQGFAKNRLAKMPENVPARTRPPWRPETPQNRKYHYFTILSTNFTRNTTKTEPPNEALWRPFGDPLGAWWRPNSERNANLVQFSSVQLFNCSIEIAFLWFSHAFLGRFSEAWKMQTLFSCSIVRLRWFALWFSHGFLLGNYALSPKANTCLSRVVHWGFTVVIHTNRQTLSMTSTTCKHN